MPAAGTSSGLLELIEYGNRVRDGGYADLAAEHQRLTTADSPRSDAAIRLALLVSAPDTPLYDADEAVRLLRGVVSSAPPNDDTALAELLLHMLDASASSPAQDEALATRLSEARDRNQQLSAALDSARSALAEERERRLALEEQLHALKRLEEQLSLDLF